MEWREYYEIERLGDRIAWMIGYMPSNEAYGTIDSKTAVFNALNNVDGISTRTRSQFDKWMSGSSGVPLSLVKGLTAIFPTVSPDLITCPIWDEFHEQTSFLTDQLDRWTAATQIVAKNRGELASLGKQYYRGVDEMEADFPLIARKQWFHNKPIRLSEIDPVSPFRTDIVDAVGPDLFDGYGKYHLIKRRSLPPGKTMRNEITYRLASIDSSHGKLRFSFSPGRYFNYVDTCELAAAELADWYTNNEGALPTELPMRGRPECIFEFANRSAPPGINCLLLLKNYFVGSFSDETKRFKNKFVLHERSNATTEAQNTVHVVPAGTHQPVSKGFESEIDQSIWRTVVREFLEEIFNEDKAAISYRSSAEFFDNFDIKNMIDKIFRTDDVAAVYLLGVGFDPLTTKPEILVSIVIDWYELAKKYTMPKFDDNYEGSTLFIDLSRENLIAEAKRPRNKNALLPAGAACLLRAAEPEIYETLFNME